MSPLYLSTHEKSLLTLKDSVTTRPLSFEHSLHIVILLTSYTYIHSTLIENYIGITNKQYYMDGYVPSLIVSNMCTLLCKTSKSLTGWSIKYINGIEIFSASV